MLFMKYVDKKDLIDTTDATATAEDITKGKTAYIKNKKVIGTKKEEVSISITEPTGDDKPLIWIQKKSKNLYNKDLDTLNYALNLNNGQISQMDNRTVSGYIEVNPNTTYTLSNDGVGYTTSICEYNSSKTFIKSLQEITFTTSANTKYIRFHHYLPTRDTEQLELGDTVSPFEPYTEPGLYIRNTDGEYVVFDENTKY